MKKFLIAMCLVASQVFAATAVEQSTTVQLKRGSSNVTLIPSPTTLAECEQRKAGLIAIDAETKFSGTSTYSCVETLRSVVTFSPNAPPPPVDCVVSDWGDWVLGTPSACVNGQQSRSDTRTRTIVTQPANGGAACPTLSDARTETLTCAVEPPPPALTAPVLEPLTVAPHTTAGRYNITLKWSAVPGATSYEVRRCTGPSCTGFTLIKTVTASPYVNTNLPGGFSYTYRVRAMKGTEAGPTSGNQTLVTSSAPPPPPPDPPPAGTGAATLRWTPPTTNTDGSPVSNLAGYRVEYGTDAVRLNDSLIVNGAGVSTFVVNDLAPGTWFFAVRAVTTSGGMSERSDIVSKTIP